MKELSKEEKAKRYDELKITAQELEHDGCFDKITLFDLFPELKESEDERIKKEITELIMQPTWKTEKEFHRRKELCAWLEKQGKNNMGISEATKKKLEDNLNKALEKETPESFNKFLDEQGEQKPADKVEPKFKIGDKVHLINGSSPNYEDDCIVISDISNNTYYGNWEGGYFAIKDQDKYELVEQKPAWSEEDEKLYQSALWHIKNSCGNQGKTSGEYEVYYFVKSLKDKCLPQPQQEWSEEDLSMIGRIRSIIEKYAFSQSAVDVNGELCEKEFIDADNWLKSLHPQKQWKPSDEQIRILELAIDYWKPNDVSVTTPLYNLLEKLKKLRDE